MEIIIAIVVIYLLFKLLAFLLPKIFGKIYQAIRIIFKYIVLGPALFCGFLASKILGFLRLRAVATFLLIGILLIFSFDAYSTPIILCGLLFSLSVTILFIIQLKSFSRQRKISHQKEFATDNYERYKIIFASVFAIAEGYYLPRFFYNLEIIINYTYTLLLFYICSVVLLLINIRKWQKNLKILDIRVSRAKYFQQECKEYFDDELEEKLVEFSNSFIDNDSNAVHFGYENIPYGRAVAFLSYFGKSIDFEQPLYYSPKRSPDENELREYGTLVTSRGLYFSNYQQPDKNIQIEGIWKIINDENGFSVFYDFDKSVYIPNSISSISANSIKKYFDNINFEKIPISLYNHKIKYEPEDSFVEELEREEKEFEKDLKIKGDKKIIETAGLAVDGISNAQVYGELKNNMNGARGSGYGAEYGNAVADRVAGYKVENLAAQLDENGRQVKGGADKSIQAPFGEKVNIQTKYYKTASESIGAAFEHKQAIYLNPDGTMMTIEVPRDQYPQALQEMQNRIDNGQVPDANPGDDARKYVKKGFFTYEQSFNLTRAGSIEGLTVDFAQGIICSTGAGAITTLLTFATAVWNGKDVKDAAKEGLSSGIKVMGKGTAIYTITMQLSRGTIINPFDSRALLNTNTGLVELTEGFIRKNAKGETILKISDGHLFALDGNKLVDKGLVSKGKVYNADGTSRGFAFIENPVFKVADGVANKISTSTLANTSVGEAIGLDKVTGRSLIAGTVTFVVVFGPDLCRAFQGKISPQQLFKNSATSAAGLAGASVGQALIPIPFVGAMIGGAVAGFVAKKVLDNFIEDDAKEMFQIIKEEFLDVVMLYSLSKNEFDEVMALTIGNKNLPKIMRDMYAAEDSRAYARKGFIEIAVIETITKRKKITNEMFEAGITGLLESDVA